MNADEDELPPPRRRGSSHRLSEANARNFWAKKMDIPRGHVKKLPDGNQVWLQKSSGGSCSWYMNLPLGKKTKWVPFRIGVYPDMNVEAMRHAVMKVRELLAKGLDPRASRNDAQERREARAALTFGAVVTGWFDDRAGSGAWSTPTTTTRSFWVAKLRSTALWNIPLHELHATHVLPAIDALVERTPATADRLFGLIPEILTWADGRFMQFNPRLMRLTPPEKLRVHRRLGRRHHPAILDLIQLGEVMRRSDSSSATPAMMGVLRALAWTEQRLECVLVMCWEDIDLGKEIWTIPGDQLKGWEGRIDRPAVLEIPLVTQLVEYLKGLNPEGKFVFPSPVNAGEPLTQTGVASYLRRMGLSGIHRPHSFRVSFSTYMNSFLDANGQKLYWEIVEEILAHLPPGPVRFIYDRSVIVERRRNVLQIFADALEDGERVARQTTVVIEKVVRKPRVSRSPRKRAESSGGSHAA